MVWTTGLVSLSIHEALTFEGVEIALNPDLFNDPSPSRSGGRPMGNSSIASSAKQKPHHQRINSASDSILAAVPSIDADSKTDDGKLAIGNSASFSTANSVSNRRLEVGDMIDIRVWDPLPNSPKHSPKTLKRRSPPASKDSSRGASGSNSLEDQTLRRPSSTSATLEAAVSSLQKTTQAASSSGSLQYSVDSSFPKAEQKEEHAKDGDASTVSSIDRAKETIEITSDPPSPKETVPNTVTAAGEDNNRAGMPPTFPRSRTDTADGNSRLLTSKPPPVQRSRTNTTAPVETTDSRRRTSTSTFVPQNAGAASKPASSHVRDISDMTMDTILGSNIVSDVGDDDHDDDTLSRISSTHKLRFSFVMLVTEGTLTSLKESARTQVSMLRQVADLYNLSSYDMVTVNKISKEEEPACLEEVSADFVTVTIKEQYISRGDMHFFQKSLIGKWIYEGQRLSNTAKGVQAHAREIRHGKRLALSGIVTDNTMITFRSRSARIFWLVQISSEMWDYASPYNSTGGQETSCEIYFDKFVSFMYRLFEKWQELEVTHSLTVVFFSRTYLNSNKGISPGRRKSEGGNEEAEGIKAQHTNVDVCGRMYEDHYKTVIENETTADWDSLIVRIKREFVKYPFEVGWNLETDETGRRPSTAAQGNLLEAVNVTLNLMQFHYMDRDLHRVGNSLVIISAGCGVFEVDRSLAGITYQRMMDNGIGSDMLSLGLPPLHTAPFFHYNNDLFAVEAHGVDEDKNYHEVPHWMHLSFFSYGDEAYLHDKKIQPNDKKDLTSPERIAQEIEVAPNGFYIPNLQNEFEQNLMRLDTRRTSFSALANVAASPSSPSRTSQSRQRQLISGRKFSDILEACRPGTTRHAMPSALSYLLIMYEVMKHAKESHDKATGQTARSRTRINECQPGKIPTDGPRDAHRVGSQLKEWGAVDVDEITSLAQSPTTLGMKRTHDLGVAVPRDTMSDRSNSPTSSLSSHLSNLMSRSLERGTSLYSYGGGFQLRGHRMVDGIQMQRSPSMESLKETLDDTGITTVSNDKNVDESGIIEGEEAVASNLNVKKKEMSDADYLRKLMRQRDGQFFQRNQSYIFEERTAQLPMNSRHGSEGSVESSGTLPISNVAAAQQPTGGLGAALKNYNSSSSKKSAVSENPSMQRNVSFRKQRDVSQSQSSPYPLSRSLGPFDGPSPQFRPPVLPSRGSDPFQPLPPPRGLSQASGSSDKRSFNSNVGFLAASSPPRSNNIGKKTQSPPSDADDSPLKRLSSTSKKIHQSKRRSRTLNPFKQQDEDSVLAEKSHNRRRWSHVFPLGEIEFKRHAGPNWLSLSQPAVLPLTIDYYPPPQELNTFLIREWDIEVDVEGSHYKSHSELMMEMIRQRLVQEYQVVPKSVVQESRRRDEAAHLATQIRARSRNNVLPSPAGRSFLQPETVSLGRDRLLRPRSGKSPTGSRQGQEEIVEHHLSMGHTIHILRYDPNTSEKKIVATQLNKRRSQDNSFRYKFMLYSTTTQSYVKVVQDFHEFQSEYRWNQVDHLICGIEAKKVAGEMRFRQLQFALIPEQFNSETEEQAYVEKFQKLLEYLNKLREGDAPEDALDIQIITSKDKRVDPKELVPFVRREAVDMMKRITVQLRKGKRDLYEWVDIAVDPTFDTRRSFRIVTQWLAASSSKVDAQIQLIQRRALQFGLKLVSIPELSVTPNLFLNPLHAPTLLCVLDKEDADRVDEAILERDFVDDGIHLTEKSFLECVKHADQFKFSRRPRVAARQFVHRSGILFIRLIRDLNGKIILVAIENRMLMGRDTSKREVCRAAFRRIETFVQTLPSLDASQHESPTKERVK